MDRRRRFATYAMLLGLILAAAMLAVGGFLYRKATGRLTALEVKCADEARKPVKKDAIRNAIIGLFKDPDFQNSDRDSELRMVKAVLAGDPDFAKLTEDDQNDIVISFISKACEPKVLGKFESLKGVGLQIQEQFSSRQHAWENVEFYALVIALLFSVPRFWYFRLGRIGEISAAKGNAP